MGPAVQMRSIELPVVPTDEDTAPVAVRHRPTAIVALGEDGSVVARQQLHPGALDAEQYALHAGGDRRPLRPT